MKSFLTILLFLFIVIFSCTKNTSSNTINTFDERDDVIGLYTGIKVETRWQDTVIGYSKDTSNISLMLTKSNSLDSIINVSFSDGNNYNYKYNAGNFIYQTNYHAPTLTKYIDSLYFYHQPGLGPIWTECFVSR